MWEQIEEFAHNIVVCLAKYRYQGIFCKTNNALDYICQQLPLLISQIYVYISAMPKSKRQDKYSDATQRKIQESRCRYGNFSYYYGYRNPMNCKDDQRLDLLQPEWIKNNRCLDIGCNAGFITVEIAKRFNPAEIIGIDIDPKLIRTARQHLYLVNSLRRPPASFFNFLHNGNAQLSHLPSASSPNDSSYFPISMPLLYGTIPVRPFASQANLLDSEPLQPNNIEKDTATDNNSNDIDENQIEDGWARRIKFFHADWLNDATNSIDNNGYDVVLAQVTNPNYLSIHTNTK